MTHSVVDVHLRRGYVSHVVIDDFLPDTDLTALDGHLRSRREYFEDAQVGGGLGVEGRVDLKVRRGRVLYDLGLPPARLTERLRTVEQAAADRLGLRPPSTSSLQIQATSTNDGEYFCQHTDEHTDRVESLQRWLSFTFFINDEPKKFSGGELRISAAIPTVSSGRLHYWSDVDPVRNRIVLFPSNLPHEIAPVSCPSRRFDDSRLTVNGWFLR